MKHLTYLLASTAISFSAYAENWDMPTPYSDTTFHTINIQQFADEVTAATNGDLTITLHSAGSLFPGGEIKNAVRSGQANLGEFFLSTLSNEDAVFGLDSQPFLATTFEDAAKLWEAQRDAVAEKLAEQKLMPLFSVPWPAQSLYTNGEINTLEDLSGKRLRAYNAALEEFAALAKMAPVQVEAADIPQAFSTGQVDAMITSPSTGVSSKAWDYTTNYTAIDAWFPKNIVIVNKAAFEALPEETQKIVLDAAAAAETRGWEMSKAEASAMVAQLTENGMTVVDPTEELTASLQGIGDEMIANWKTSASEAALSVYEAYMK